MKYLIPLSLLILALIQSFTLACNHTCRAQMVQWKRPVVLTPTVTNIPLSSEIPMKDCKEVISVMTKAKNIMDRLLYEHNSLIRYIEYYSHSGPETLRLILPEVKRRTDLIKELTEEMKKSAPPNYATPDRIRTLRWEITPASFPLLRRYPSTKAEWADLIVLKGVTPPLINALPPTERPALKGTTSLEPSGTEKEEDTDLIRWQGPGPIELTQTLDPLEACMTQYHVVGSLLVDLIQKRGGQEYRFYGQGPILLHYGISP